jgi:predicted phosphodiesterase
MKLGILTDIHEHTTHLQAALERFKTERVDQIVVMGDVFEMGERIEEARQLLAESKAIGVWGNHDFGLCVDPDMESRCKYGERVINFMTSLRPRVEIGDCHFMHVEPWLNPEDIADLWYRRTAG